MSSIHLPISIFEILQSKLGAEEARTVASAIEVSFQAVKDEAKNEALIKKLEIKDELSKELVTKSEFQAELKAMRAEINRNFYIGFTILASLIILLNQNALQLIFSVLGLIK